MCETQWHTGMSGVTGLMYPPIYELLDRRGFSGEEWWRMFSDIREMERAALRALREQ